MSFLRSINSAISLLTVIPTPNIYPRQPGYAFAYFPLVGASIGIMLMGIHAFIQQIMPIDAVAFVTLGVWVLLTGGLHLDGFGDTCDGAFTAVDKARRLEIMKDPRTGSWAVIGLVLLLLGKWIGLRQIQPVQLILVTSTARWVMAAVAYSFPYARNDGMGGYFKQGLEGPQFAVATLSIWGVLAFFYQDIVAVLGVLMWITLVAIWLSSRLGGLTGDTYGALCELTELTLLLVLAG